MVGKRLALVIGNNYPNSDKELKFAVADATKMKEVLENKDICAFDNVILLINKTSKDVLTEIETLFTNAHQDDLIFIYFSGHGKKDFKNDLYLLFKDTNEKLLLATALPFDYIDKCRKYPQAQRASVVIVLDCCYSAAAGMKDTDIEEKLANYSSRGTIILTSTGSTGIPTAMEDDKLGHSFFTYYLIEGLEKGCADKDEDGLISIDELYMYAFKKTTTKCSQSPAKKGSIEGSIYIGKNPQIVREREYESKKEKLIKEFGSQLPPIILSESQTILRKYYKTSSLESVDTIILDNLESLLNGEILAENYVETVQQLKGINTYKSSIKQKEKEREDKEKEALEKKQQEEFLRQREESEQKQREEEKKRKEKEALEKERSEKKERSRRQREEDIITIKRKLERESLPFLRKKIIPITTAILIVVMSIFILSIVNNIYEKQTQAPSSIQNYINESNATFSINNTNNTINNSNTISEIPSQKVELSQREINTNSNLSNSFRGNDEWKYSQDIIITENAGQSLEDYPVLISLNSSNFDFSKAQNDGSDIRFFSDIKKLKHWIESWDSGNKEARIWVKIPSLPAKEKDVILMKYGNPEAEDESKGKDTFDFFDDFEDSTFSELKWTTESTGGGTVKIENGKCKVSAPEANVHDTSVIYSRNTFDINSMFVVKRMKITTGTDSRGPLLLQGFIGQINSKNNQITHKTKLADESHVSWEVSIKEDYNSPDLTDTGVPEGQWYVSGVAWFEGKENREIAWFKNGVRDSSMNYASDEAVPSSVMHIYLRTESDSDSSKNTGDMTVDYAYVRKFINIEPTVFIPTGLE